MVSRERVSSATSYETELREALKLRRVDALIAEHSSLMILWGSSRQAAQTRLVLISGIMAGMFSICANTSHWHYGLMCCSGMLTSAYWLVGLHRTYEAMDVRLKHGCRLERQLAQALNKEEVMLNLDGRRARDFEALDEDNQEKIKFTARKGLLEQGQGTPQFFTELALRTTWAETLRGQAEGAATGSDGRAKEGMGLSRWLATARLCFHTLLPWLCTVVWLIILCVSMFTQKEATSVPATHATREKVSDEAAIKSDTDAYNYAAFEYTQYDQEGDRHLLRHWHGRGLAG